MCCNERKQFFVVKNCPTPNANRAPFEKHSSSSLVGRLFWDPVLIINIEVTQVSDPMMVTSSAVPSQQPMSPGSWLCAYSRMVMWPCAFGRGLFHVGFSDHFLSVRSFTFHLFICCQTTQCFLGIMAYLPRFWSSLGKVSLECYVET